jgi:hypothetical protein
VSGSGFLPLHTCFFRSANSGPFLPSLDHREQPPAESVIPSPENPWEEGPPPLATPTPIVTQPHADPPDFSLSLYTPLTKKLSPYQLTEIMRAGKTPDSTLTLVGRYLSDATIYEQILRGKRLQDRKKFYNNAPLADVQKMIESKIIERVSTKSSPSKAFCKMTSVNERKKNRRRLLFEPRDLNDSLKKRHDNSLMPKISLIKAREIEERISNASTGNIESIDFRSFYYQILLAEEVRCFFRIIINNELFQLRVLPMGASFSCFIAQTVALASAHILQTDTDLPPIVYIDNIFFFSSTLSPLSQKRKIPVSLPEVGDHTVDRQTPILGRVVDMNKEGRFISLTPHTISKIENVFRQSCVDRAKVRVTFRR